MSVEPIPAPRFRLLRYFTLATLGAFLAAGVALVMLQRSGLRTVEDVLREQQAHFARSQAELAQQNEEAARASLLAVHEASHVTLTGVVANLMWAQEIAPFLARAQALSPEDCRALPRGDPAGAGEAKSVALSRQACFARLGETIATLPGFRELDTRAYAAMRGTTVFKVKVWDLRGITVYSSEHAQMGSDGWENKGFRTALEGQPASELTHRARFSAFERVVEGRDLISTYVPVRERAEGPVVGVFELYSDVTPFLAQTRLAADRFVGIARSNEEVVARASSGHLQQLRDSSLNFLALIGGLLALLYGVSLVIVHVGQRIIDRQAQAEDEAKRREQLWHHEKMAMLGAMADNVAHEVGNPLAVIAGVAEELAPGDAAGDGRAVDPSMRPSRLILEQTDRIARMMRRISAYASARGTSPQWVDLNGMVRTLCDFQTYDRRYAGVVVRFEPGEHLPACELVPDRMNEAMTALLRTTAERSAAYQPPRPVQVHARARGEAVSIELRWGDEGPSGSGEWQAVADRPEVARGAAGLGARLVAYEHGLSLDLPPPAGH